MFVYELHMCTMTACNDVDTARSAVCDCISRSMNALHARRSKYGCARDVCVDGGTSAAVCGRWMTATRFTESVLVMQTACAWCCPGREPWIQSRGRRSMHLVWYVSSLDWYTYWS